MLAKYLIETRGQARESKTMGATVEVTIIIVLVVVVAMIATATAAPGNVFTKGSQVWKYFIECKIAGEIGKSESESQRAEIQTHLLLTHTAHTHTQSFLRQ